MKLPRMVPEWKEQDGRKSERKQSRRNAIRISDRYCGTKNADPRNALGASLGHGQHRKLRPWLVSEIGDTWNLRERWRLLV